MTGDQTEPAKLSFAPAPTLDGVDVTDSTFSDEEREKARLRRIVEDHKRQQAHLVRQRFWRRRRRVLLLLVLIATTLFVIVRRLG